jgi:oxygen-dependent protoporphyrinogen oxidase
MSRTFVVIGGGIAGLAAALELAEGSRPGSAAPTVTLLEASDRFGGKIATEHRDGFLLEAGPDSFARHNPAGLGLVRELGLDERLLPTRPGRVYAVHGRRLVPLPAGLHLVVPTRLAPALASPLLSWRGKARLLGDLVLPRRRGEGEESVGSFVRRRLGAEYLARVAGPLLAGIHATDADRLSLEAAFPRLAGLERRHRSLILGARRESGGAGRDHESGGARVTLAGGLGELVGALVGRLGERGVELRTGRPAAALEAVGGPGSGPAPAWRLRFEGGGELEADGVVLAVPAARAGRLLAGVAPGLAAPLAGLPAASTATVSLAYPRGAVRHPLDGVGFLVPAGEGLAVTACTFSSSKFPGRAPEGHVLLRAYVGGSRGGERARGEEAELVARVHGELTDLLGLSGEPVLTRVHRFLDANPRYVLGRAEQVGAVEAALPPGLALAGCAYHGLGIPDCIASGRRAAQRLRDRY